MSRIGVIVLSLAVVGCGCWKLPAIPSGQRSQYYTQQSDGSYKFGFDSTQGLYHVQQANGANEVQGTFGSPGGSLSYTSGVNGFQLKGDNTLGSDSSSYHDKPSSQIDPVWTQSSSNANNDYGSSQHFDGSQSTLPSGLFEPVTDTPEVAEARRKFLEAYYKAAMAANVSPHSDSGNSDASYSSTHQQQSNQGKPLHNTVKDSGHGGALYSSTHQQSNQGKPIHNPDKSSGHGDASYPFQNNHQSNQGEPIHNPDKSYGHGDASYSFAHQHQSNQGTGMHQHSQNYHTSNTQSPAKKPIRYPTWEELTSLPVPVGDTPAVTEAKKAFFQLYQAAAKAAEDAPDDPQTGTGAGHSVESQTIYYHQTPTTKPEFNQQSSELYVAPSPVKDTAEVSAAKEAFFQHYKAAKAAAQAAPDHEVSSSYSGNSAESSHTSGYSSHVIHTGPQQHVGQSYSASSAHTSHGNGNTDGVIHYGLEQGGVNVAFADGASSKKFGYSYQ